MKKYTDIFFDLDDTIWNFSLASYQALKKVYENYNLQSYFKTLEEFIETFEAINKKLWEQYRKNKIEKETVSVVRFIYTLEQKTQTPQYSLAHRMGDSYLVYTTDDNYLEPYAREIIRYLKEKGYRIHIISDGFFEVQILKIKKAKISSFISHLIYAEEVGVLKPDPRIFEYAIKKANTTKEKSIFIGNDYKNDILGAYSAGIDQIFYNKQQIKNLYIKPTYTIQSLKELEKIFL